MVDHCAFPGKFSILLFIAMLPAPAWATGQCWSTNRTINGSCNNPYHRYWGAAGTDLLRRSTPAYENGAWTPSGADRPDARHISNVVVAQPRLIPNDRGASDYLWLWGQFVDHDLDLSPEAEPVEPFDIPVPICDPWFDPDCTGDEIIPLHRSEWAPDTGTCRRNPREQVNALTSWLDGSQIYGSDEARAAWLRTGHGGKLKVTDSGYGPLLPYNDGTIPNGPDMSPAFFVAGDVRANEQASLTAMHTLWLREHNRLAGLLAEEHPRWSDERIYQRARKLVGAEIQVVTYEEFLPLLLAEYDVPPYEGYDPGIRTAFATAAYRFGHSATSPMLLRLDGDWETIPEGDLPLEQAFFNPLVISEQGGIEPLLRGLAFQLHQQIDPYVVDALRNILFRQNLDLASLNIQRGRDHGLPDYNTLREDYGLPPATGFDMISSDPEIQARLAAAYDGDLNRIDPWVGMLAEDVADGAAMIGPLFRILIRDQFAAIRDGYGNDPAFSRAERRELRKVRLSHVIERNSGIVGLPEDVFRVGPEPLAGELTMLPDAIRCGGDGYLLATLTLPEGIEPSDLQPGSPLLLYPGRIPSISKVVLPPIGWGRHHRPTSVLALFRTAELLAALEHDGQDGIDGVEGHGHGHPGRCERVQVQVAGELRSRGKCVGAAWLRLLDGHGDHGGHGRQNACRD